MTRLPVLWLCGAPGAGKSVSAWSLFQQVARAGATVGYLDIDQVGMLYPESEDDPERYDLKTEALAALVPQYVAAGARALIVSGILDPGWSDVAAHDIAGATVTYCLLDPGESSLRTRILARGGDQQDAGEAVAENATLVTAPFVDHVINTAGVSVEEVVARARPLMSMLETPDLASAMSVRRSSIPVGVLVISGARVVGTSTVGFGLARSGWNDRVVTGFADLDQLSFLCGPGAASAVSSLGAANLAALHTVFGRRGAEWFVVSAHLPDQRAHDLVRSVAAQVRVVRLRADRQSLEAHIEERTHGSDARLAGDDLVGASSSYQADVLARALAEQTELDARADEDQVVNVSGRGVDEILSTPEVLGHEGNFFGNQFE